MWLENSPLDEATKAPCEINSVVRVEDKIKRSSQGIWWNWDFQRSSRHWRRKEEWRWSCEIWIGRKLLQISQISMFKMTDLEKYIDEVSRRIGVKLEKTVETTPSRGNCWYEAVALLSRTNNVKNISAKQLREMVVNNLENCPNFNHFFEISCNSDHEKLKQF